MAPQWCFKEFRIIVHGGTLNECRIIVHGTLSQWPRGFQLVTHGTLIEFLIFISNHSFIIFRFKFQLDILYPLQIKETSKNFKNLKNSKFD